MTVLPFPVAADLNAREEACLWSGPVRGGGVGGWRLVSCFNKENTGKEKYNNPG